MSSSPDPKASLRELMQQRALGQLDSDQVGSDVYAQPPQIGQMPGDDEILDAAGPAHGEAILNAHRDMLKAKSDLQEAQLGYFDKTAAAIQASNYDPGVADVLLQHAAGEPEFADQANQIRALVRQNPEALRPIVDNLLQSSDQPSPGQQDQPESGAGPAPGGDNQGAGGSNSIVDMTAQQKTASRIPQPVSRPDVKPNLNLRPPDPKQARATLSGLMLSGGEQRTAPLGVSPSGSLMRDVTGLAKTPSRIPKPPVDGLIYGDKVSPEFLTKVDRISSSLGIDPNWLMAVMAFESGGTFSPSVPNAAGSSGVGLIQFTKSTGYDLNKLAKMTAEDQLDKVAEYLEPYQGKLGSLSDLYMSVLWPQAIGKPDDYVLFSSPSIQYQQNSALDVDGKGAVTKADAAAAVERRYRQGVQRGTTTLRPDGSSESRVGNKTIVQPPKQPRVVGQL
jgi:hypothetical protein